MVVFCCHPFGLFLLNFQSTFIKRKRWKYSKSRAFPRFRCLSAAGWWGIQFRSWNLRASGRFGRLSLGQSLTLPSFCRSPIPGLCLGNRWCWCCPRWRLLLRRRLGLAVSRSSLILVGCFRHGLWYLAVRRLFRLEGYRPCSFFGRRARSIGYWPFFSFGSVFYILSAGRNSHSYLCGFVDLFRGAWLPTDFYCLLGYTTCFYGTEGSIVRKLPHWQNV